MKIVYRAADIIEAHIVSGMLSARGIEAHVGGYFLQGGIGELPPLGTSNVTVGDDDFDAAMAVIDEYEQKDGSESRRPSRGEGKFSA